MMQIARIRCGKTNYMLPEGLHTGSNLRAFFGVKESQNLWGECDKDDTLIPDDDAAIMVEDGAKFYIASKKRNGG